MGRGQSAVANGWLDVVNLPADVQLADIEGEKKIVWRLEVWGRVRGWANFGHPSVIRVLDW